MGAVTAKVPFSGRKVPHGTIPTDEGFAVDSTDSEERGILGLISSLCSLERSDIQRKELVVGDEIIDLLALGDAACSTRNDNSI